MKLRIARVQVHSWALSEAVVPLSLGNLSQRAAAQLGVRWLIKGLPVLLEENHVRLALKETGSDDPWP